MITQKEDKNTEEKGLAKYIQETLDICIKENEKWKMRISFLFEQYKRLQNLISYERAKNPALVNAFLTIQSYSYQEKELDKEKLLARIKQETELIRAKMEPLFPEKEKEIEKEKEKTEGEVEKEAEEFLKKHNFSEKK